MEKHILFFDIDGTLVVEERGYVPLSTQVAIKRAQQNGHLVFVNSGRVRCEIEPNILDLHVDGYICGCGCYIEYKNEVLLSKTLSHELSKQIAEDMETYQLDGVLEGTNHIYFRRPCRRASLERARKHFLSVIGDAVKDWTDPKICCDKLAIWFDEHSDMEGFQEKYKDVFEFIRREIDFYELIPHGYSKATGIEYICKHLDIPLDHVIAVGDSTNDLSMLKFVKKSIAMGNSNPVLFDYVDYITTDISDNGIYNGLKHYEIIK